MMVRIVIGLMMMVVTGMVMRMIRWGKDEVRDVCTGRKWIQARFHDDE